MGMYYEWTYEMLNLDGTDSWYSSVLAVLKKSSQVLICNNFSVNFHENLLANAI